MAEANTIYNSLVSGLSNTYFSLADSPAANNFLYTLANTISNSTTLSYAEYQHTSSGTDGGTAINGAWRVLPINTEVVDGIDSSLSNNVITLSSGKYEIDFIHLFYKTDTTMMRLKIVAANNTSYKYSTVGYAPFSALTSMTTVQVGGKAVVDFLTSNGGNISTEYMVQTSKSTDGLGHGASFSVTNVYGYIWIKRI